MVDRPPEAQPIWAVTPEKMDEAVRRVVEAAHPVRIILFGSYARGDVKADSDLDLLVVEEEVADAGGEAIRLRQALDDLLMAVDIVVVAREKFEYWKDTPGNVYYEAAQDGRAVYEAT